MGPGDLGRILCGLNLPTDSNLIVGSETCDDAGVYRLDDSTALIQTLDFFTPIVDDPFDFGRITAANALSDVYAMGGRPLLCMNILACPVESMEEKVFRRVVEGGLSKIREAGALLVGGHSIEDSELKYGLAVTGIVHPDRVLLNSGARPGDLLVLTKPLGTGILATAIKGGLAGEETGRLLVETMAALNRLPAEIAGSEEFRQRPEVAVHGCTDVTGFGLAGHAYEMAAASGVAIHLDAGRLPILPDVAEYVEMGIIPEGAYTNRRHYAPWFSSRLTPDSVPEMVVFDPQTSGGLLLALTPAAAQLLLERLQSEDPGATAVVVGEVREGGQGTVVLEEAL